MWYTPPYTHQHQHCIVDTFQCFVCAKMTWAFEAHSTRLVLSSDQLLFWTQGSGNQDWTWTKDKALCWRRMLVNLCLLVLLFYRFPRTRSYFSHHLQCCNVARQVSIASDIILHPPCYLMQPHSLRIWTRLQLRKCPFSLTWLASPPSPCSDHKMLMPVSRETL